MLTDTQRLSIACVLVREKRCETEVIEETQKIPVHGITLRKLLRITKRVSRVYHQRKKERKKPDFEEILEDIIIHDFPSKNAQHIVKQVLGHFFSWRRNESMPKIAHKTALQLGFLLV